MGAKGKYTKETVEAICEGILALKGKVRAAKEAGISYETFRTWTKTKPAFSAIIKKAIGEAREAGKEKAILCIFEAMPKNWQAAAWWLERNYPNEFRNVQEQKHSVDMKEARQKLAKIIDAKFKKAG